MLLTIVDVETHYINIKLQQKFIGGTDTLLIKILRRFNIIEMGQQYYIRKGNKTRI